MAADGRVNIIAAALAVSTSQGFKVTHMASIASLDSDKNISFCGARAIFASPVSFIIRLLLVQPSFSSSPGHKRPVRSTWSVNINRIPRTLSFLENRNAALA